VQPGGFFCAVRDKPSRRRADNHLTIRLAAPARVRPQWTRGSKIELMLILFQEWQGSMANGQCHLCDGSGCCPTCEGRGTMPNTLNSNRLPCGTCFGSGDCPACSEDCDTPSDYKQPAAESK
jgi:hypothetical protein